MLGFHKALYRLRTLFRARLAGQRVDEGIELHRREPVQSRSTKRPMSTNGGSDVRPIYDVAAVGRAYHTDAQLSRSLDSLLSAFRLAFRSLLKRPGFCLGVVGTLALGIGANTAVFSLVDALLLKPLAVHEPERLLGIYTVQEQTPYGGSSSTLYDAFRSRASTLDGIAGYWTAVLSYRDGDDTRDVFATLTTGNYFQVLGVPAELGRTLTPTESHDGTENHQVVLSAAFWRRNFAADSTIVGRNILVNGQLLTVVGIAAKDFQGTDLTVVPDMWLPLSLLPYLQLDMLTQAGQLNPHMAILTLFGRLAPGVDIQRASAELRSVAHGVATTSPFAQGGVGESSGITVIPLAQAAAGVRNRPVLIRVTQGLVAIVLTTLLLACLNVANLLLIRAQERTRELAIRAALGAGPRQLASQLLVESSVLAFAGAAAGIVGAGAALSALSGVTLPGGIRIDNLHLAINLRVLTFTCVIAVLTALAFGIVPTAMGSRLRFGAILGHRTQGHRVGLNRFILAAAQVALCIVMLVNAGLLIRSVRAGFSTDLGFDVSRLAAISVAPSKQGRYADAFGEYQEVVAALRGNPGTTAAAAATHVPLAPFATQPVGTGPAPDNGVATTHSVMMGVNYITDDYFTVLDVPLVAGRMFGEQDVRSAPRVMILNESAAKHLWRGRSPIGQVVHTPWFGPANLTYVVVGVVKDTKYGGTGETETPFAFVPMAQVEPAGRSIHFVSRSANPHHTLASMQRTLAEIAPTLRPAVRGTRGPRARLLTEQVAATLAPHRAGAALLTAFAMLSLVVSAVGIFGSVAYSVSQRTAEIGIRLALGSRASQILRLVVGDTLRAVASGGIIGLATAFAVTRFVAPLLVGVGRFDLFATSVAVALMVFVAAAAALLPAWRALRIDPLRAMRVAADP